MNLKLNIAILAIVALVFSSCLKSDDNYSQQDPIAALKVVNASPGSTSLDVSLDNNRLWLEYFNFGVKSNYFRALTGTRSFKVYSGNNANAIFTKDINLQKDKYYTAFIVDTASKMDVVVVRDSTKGATLDSVRIRFANMSPDAPGLDLYANGGNTPIATNISYKQATEFFSIRSAANVIFDIKPHGQNTLLATLDPINLPLGYIYTIWAGGYVNGNSAEGKNIKLKAFTH